MEEQKKAKVILVGGKDFNIPRQLYDAVDILRHYSHDMRGPARVPPRDLEYVFGVQPWCSVPNVRKIGEALGVKVVFLQEGWSRIKCQLEELGLLKKGEPPPPPPDIEPEVVAPPPAKEVIPSIGLSQDELLTRYKDKAVDGLKNALKPSDRMSRDELIETMAWVTGLPPVDCESILPELVMRGVVQEHNETWTLTSYETVKARRSRG